jgi:Flp pilus assembly pilin Flp
MIGGDSPRQADQGSSTVEYGLLIAAVAALILMALLGFGAVIQDQYVGSCIRMDGQLQNTGICTP